MSSDTPRPCTCHPLDNPPVPCPQKFALTECRLAAKSAEVERMLAANRWEVELARASERAAAKYNNDLADKNRALRQRVEELEGLLLRCNVAGAPASAAAAVHPTPAPAPTAGT